jgi:PAS domain S-box-containing protein
MPPHDNEEKLLRSVAFQNAQAVLLARERAERELILAKEALERKSAELFEQRESFRVTLSSIGDGVITTDTEGRITFLNPVAEAMTGWKLSEAAGQPVDTVFNIVHEQARTPAPNPVTRVLREGVVVGLANHTALIARDGTETAIADSAAPIRDGSGKMSGVVMVFHDVTEQRRAERELRESNLALSEVRDHLEKRFEERTAELASTNESLKILSGQLIRAQDDERRRIARELHDSTGQVLVALAMTLNQMQKESSPANAPRFQECRELIGSATSEIRNLSYLLHPPLIDEVGLPSAVAEYAQGLEKRSGLSIEVDVSKELGRLDGDREITLFRILQEGLGNIQRHSGSAVASIKIFRLDDDVVLEIRDQGKGMPKNAGAAGNFGVGIRSMQERLRPFGGHLRIESTSAGTNVRAILPRQSSSTQPPE